MNLEQIKKKIELVCEVADASFGANFILIEE